MAQELDAKIHSVDFIADFLNKLENKAVNLGISEKIITYNVPMEQLLFTSNSLDAIWSEGAIYNIGFENGIKKWRNYLKKGGILAVSELTWLSNEHPGELEAYWNDQYPEVATASCKLNLLEQHGYSPIAYFILPEHCWTDNYYKPMRQRFDIFLQKNGLNAAAKKIIATEELEISLYDKYSSFISYGYYIAKKI